MKSILDPDFHYTNSESTDLRKTFARIRLRECSDDHDARVPGPASAGTAPDPARERAAATRHMAQ